MDLISIKALLDKYFEGETSREEEKIIRDYFNSSPEVPKEIQYAKDIFSYFNKEAEDYSDIPVKLNDRSKNRRLILQIASVAAGILILIGLYLNSSRPDKEIIYGYINGKPITEKQYAMAETKRALLLISDNLNTATKDLDYLSKLNVVEQLITKNK